MGDDIKDKLREWARTYHHSAFIASDPVRFPHRYSRKEDIEISGLLTAVLLLWQSWADIEEGGGAGRDDGALPPSICIVTPVGGRFPCFGFPEFLPDGFLRGFPCLS